MIGRIVARPFKLLAKQRCAFSSASAEHHDDHGHHHHEVKLDRETNWATYNNSNKLVSIYGYTDTFPTEVDHSDPFSHMRGKPFYSLDRNMFNDPFHHEEDHDPLYNEPHGYLFADDPLDSRYNTSKPLLVAISGITLLMIFSFFGSRHHLMKTPEEVINERNIVVGYVDEQIEAVRAEKKKLLARRDQLAALLD